MVARRQTTKRTRRPRGQGRPRRSRGRSQKDARKLCDWVRGRMDLPETPSLNKALAGKHIAFRE